jgi:hypothetical protein
MSNAISLRKKYRDVKSMGKLIRTKGNIFIFTAFPGSDCPVQSLAKHGRWQLVEEVYQLINEYKD